MAPAPLLAAALAALSGLVPAAVAQDCIPLDGGWTYCGAPGWRMESNDFNPELDAFFVHDSGLVGWIVVQAEPLPPDTAFDRVVGATLENVARRAGIKTSALELVDIVQLDWGGRTAATLLYVVPVDGRPGYFANSLLFGAEGLVQGTTVASRNGFTPGHMALHADFLSSLERTDAP